MRRWATGVLVVVSAAWLAIVLADPSGDWAGYARATLEASMVGALADWFAVVALFRRPLGLPIPHTAIVVARKEQFAQTLAIFFRENFLSGAAVGERLRTSRAVERAATWVAEPEHATRIVREVAKRGAGAFDDHREQLTGALVGELRQVVLRAPAAEVAATVVRAAASGRGFDEAVDRGCTAARRAVVEHADEMEEMFIGERPWWLPEMVQHRLFEHLVERVLDGLDAVADDPTHPARSRLRLALVELADRLEHDSELGARVKAFQQSLADDPRVREALTRIVDDNLDRLRSEVLTPGSAAEARLVEVAAALGRRVRDDPALQERIERAIEAAVTEGVSRFGADVDALVTGTISRWDAARTADQLELLLGPDLQYIRINGAVVGALAGLLIYSVARVVG